jgi:hypothetical protein
VRFGGGGGHGTERRITGRTRDDINNHLRYLLRSKDGEPKAVIGETSGDTMRKVHAYTCVGPRKRRTKKAVRLAPAFPVRSEKTRRRARRLLGLPA